VIRLTFEGESYPALFAAVKEFLADYRIGLNEQPAAPPPVSPKPEKKPKPDAKERMAKVRAAKAARNKAPQSAAQYDKEIHLVVEHEPKAKAEPLPPSDPRSSDKAWEADKQAKLEGPDPFDEPETIDPANLVALKVRTTEDLQAAYSNGKHKQVLALLSKYGNGAKSFRELQIEDFVPIRKAIDDGALA